MKRAPWLALPLITATLVHAQPAAAWDFAWSGRIEAETAELLRNDDAAQRVAGVRLLGSYDLSLTEDKLLAALRDSQLVVRLEAARVLGQRGSQRAASILISWLGDGDAKLRAIAAELNARGMLIRRGGLWQVSNVKALLARLAVIGDQSHTGLHEQWGYCGSGRV